LRIFYILYFLILSNFILLSVKAESENSDVKKVDSSFSIIIICEKPDLLITEGKRFSLNDRDKKNMEDITIHLLPDEKKVRFKRSGRWSSWFSGKFSDQEVSWSLVDLNNEALEIDEKYINFQYWKFNLDLVNRKVFENFLRKKTQEEEEALEVKTLPTVFSYPGCRKVDNYKLN